jgi:cellulose biosynthesis protein BcsQ
LAEEPSLRYSDKLANFISLSLLIVIPFPPEALAMSEHQQKVAHAQELLKKKRAQKAAAAGSLPTGPAPAGSTPSVAGTSSGEVSGLPDSSQLKFASQYFRRYELILEFKSLR